MKTYKQWKKKIIKKLDKFVEKKITIGDSIVYTFWTIFIILVLEGATLLRNVSYSYVDENDKPGFSDKCFYSPEEDSLMCRVNIKVKQYAEEDK